MRKHLVLSPCERSHLIFRGADNRKHLDIALVAGIGKFVKINIEVEIVDYVGDSDPDDLPLFIEE